MATRIELHTGASTLSFDFAGNGRRWRCRPHALALAMAGAFAATGASTQTLPTGGVAIHGQAQIAKPAASQLVVTTQNGAGSGHSAINWQSFSISAGASARFVQPDATSLSINRVVTNTPSAIFGSLSSNGRLVLVNQFGITVGAGAVVDTAGFTASALRMTDADALAGRLRFGSATDAMGGGAGLTVDGRITARDGDVVLIAPQIGIGTSALVQSPNGSTILAAGQQVEITGRGLEGISLLVQARDNEARNLGRLEGDAVAIFAGTLRHSGEIQATTAKLEGGQVVLKAAGDAFVEGAGSIVATGNRGGQIDVLGNRVAVTDQALIDVSGARGGGNIRIGGDFQGKNTDVPNAARTYLGPDAALRADALDSGDGGRVIVWADELTKAHGAISARGGALGGAGGFVEVSGKLGLVFDAAVDLRAPLGRLGTLLLDPDFIEIVNGGSDPASSGDEFSDAPSSVAIAPATLNAVGGNVMLQSDGDITFTDALTLTTPGASLTALAGNMIAVNASITTSGGNILLHSAAPGALGTGTNDNDAIYVNAAITSNGGSINLTADSCNLGCDSVVINANVNAATGTISLNGLGDVRQTALGVLTGGSLFATADSTITLNELGNNIPGDVNLFTNVGTGGSSSVSFRNSALSFNLNGAVAKGNVSIDGTGSMTTDGVIQSTTGNVSIVFVGGMNFGDDVVAAGTLTLGSTNSIISQTGGAMTVGAATTVNAGTGDIDLNSSLNNFSTISLTGGHITLLDVNALTVTALGQTANSHLYLDVGGALSLPAGPINRGTGQLSLFSGAGNLSTPGNLSGSILILSGQGGLTLAHNISATGSLALLAGGSITQTAGAIVALGATTVDAGLSNVTLTQPGNDFSSIGVDGGAVTITDTNAVILNASDVNSSLTVNANGNVTQTAPLLISGTTTINAGSGNVTLTTAGNNLNQLNVSGNALNIVEGAGSALTVLSLSSGLNQPVTLAAGHDLTLPAATIDTGTADLTLSSGNTLTIQGPLLGNNIDLSAVAGVIVGGPVDAGGNFDASVTGGASTMTVTQNIAAGAAMTLSLAGSLSVQAGSDGQVGLTAGGNQTITASGNILVQAGGTGDSNSAVIATTNSASLQSVTANGITVLGGAGGGGLGIGNYASIRAAGSQAVTAGNGGITMTGGGGTLSENYANIEQNGGAGTTQSITINGTGSIVLTGGSALGDGSHASILTDNGDSQTVTFTGGGAGRAITLTGGTNGSDAYAEIYAGTGTQTITGAGLITLTGGASGGGLSFGGGDTLGNLAAIGADSNDQTIVASGIVLQGGAAGLNNLAGVFGGGDQSITVGAGGLSLAGGGGGGSDLKNAAIVWKGSALPGFQRIFVGGGGSVTLQGGSASRTNVGIDVDFDNLSNGAFASILSHGVEQLIEFTAPGGSIQMDGGTTGSSNFAFIQATNGTQTIRGDNAANAPAITLVGGTSGGVAGEGNRVLIGAELGSQNVSASAITITGGTGGTENLAQIRQGGVSAGLAETQTVGILGTGNLVIQGGGGATNLARIQSYGVTQTVNMGANGALTLTGGTGASLNFARIEALNGDQFVTGSADITLTGGASGGATGNGNFADIRQRNAARIQSIGGDVVVLSGGAAGTENSATLRSDGNQAIAANSIALTGGNAGLGNLAQLNSSASQTIAVGSGGLALTGGNGGLTDLKNFASVFQGGLAGTNQTITVAGGGNITLQGGSSSGTNVGADNGSLAFITNQGDVQLIEFTGTGSNIGITAGSVGSLNTAGILARNGMQTIRGSIAAHDPSITMMGGSDGVAGEANGANIAANTLMQTISAKSVTLHGGSGVDSFATISAPVQSIAIDGNLSITGGGTGTSPGARIGGRGGAGGSNADLALSVTGNVTLTAGATSGAALGTTSLQTGLTNTIDLTVGGVLTMNPSAGGGTRIGSRVADVNAGDITIQAGSIVTGSGDGANNVAAIRTLGNVSLTTTSGGINQAIDSVVQANLLTVNSAGTVAMDSLANQVSNLNVTVPFFNSGDMLFTNSPGTLLTVSGVLMAGSTTMARITADDLNITGAVSNIGGPVILRPLDLARNVHIENTPTAGVLSLSPADLQQVSNATVLEIGRLDGTGTLSVFNDLASANVNANALRLLTGTDYLHTSGASIGSAATPFAHDLEIRAGNNLQLTNGNIFLLDNKSLKLFADNDGSTNGNLNIGAGTYRVGSSVNNSTGTMELKGAEITIAVSGGGSGLVEVTGSGSQTITSTVSDITIDNANNGTGTLTVRTDTGAQTLSAADIVYVTAGTGTGTSTYVRSGGNQSITAQGMFIEGRNNVAVGDGNSAWVESFGSQTVTLDSIGLTLASGGGASATKDHAAMLNQLGTAGTSQTITLNNGGSIYLEGGDSTLTNVGGSGHGSRALIESDGDAQTITLNGGGSIDLIGGTNGSRAYAQIYAKTGTQTVSGASTISLNAGASGGFDGEGNTARIAADVGTQSISAGAITLIGGASGIENTAALFGAGGQTITTNFLTLTGGADGGGFSDGNRAYVGSNANQVLNIANALVIQGGGGSLSDNAAQIEQLGMTGAQTFNLGANASVLLLGGSSTGTNVGGTGHGSRASIYSEGTAQSLLFGANGSLSLIGGTLGSRNFAQIFAENTGNQIISGAPTITLTGGASGGVVGEGNSAYIATNAGSQTISAASIALTGGAGGTENLAQISQGSAANGNTQSITIAGGGTVALQGGNGTTNLARIRSNGSAQSLAFGAGATLDLTGGTGASNNFARIQAVVGNQTITGSPDITLQGGASGGADLMGNFADIRANSASALQNIAVGALTLLAGAAGQENFAGVVGANQTITAVGNVSLTGGGSATSLDGTSGGGARIGGPGGASPTATNLTLTLGGDLTLTGGSVAGVAVGSSLGGGQLTNIIVTAGGDIMLNPGSVSTAGSRIGSPSANTAAGDIDLTAAGNITLGGAVAGETAIRTLGDVRLDGANLNLGNQIFGNTIFASSSAAVSLSNVGQLAASAASGDSIEVLAGTSFSNTAGSAALSVTAPARWLVYSADPSLDSRGGLVPDFKQYDKTFGDATPISGTGNGFLYSLAPTASVSLTGTVSKVYDGTNVATLAAGNFLVTGGIDGDVLSIAGGAAGTYDTRHAGTGKTVSTSGITVSALDGAVPVFGYGLAGSSVSGTVGEITAAPLTVSTADVNKTYNATLAAPGALAVATAGTLFGGDTLSGGSFAFTDPNVGTGKTVTVSGVSVNDGNGGLNYLLTQAPNTNSSITAASLTLSTSNVVKTYDGNTSATGALVVAGGSLFGSDSVSGGSFAFTDKNAGVGNKTVTVGGATINDGNGGANYIIGYQNNTTSTINRANITGVTGITAANKVYDGSTSATLTTSAAGFTGQVVGDSLTVASASGSFADRNVGTGKPVTVSSISLGGADAGNYNLLGTTATTTANITPASLTISTTPVTKPYDGTTGAAGNATVTGGTLASGDTLSGGSFAFTDPNVGTGKTVNVSGVTVNDGNGGANYAISFASNTASIITALAAANWSGLGGNSLWSNPANWDVLPVTGNVLAVSIPAGAGTVEFDAAAGTTSLQSLASGQPVSVTGGTLQLATSLVAPSLNQSGGALQVGTSLATTSLALSAGTLQVGSTLTTGSLSQTGGSLNAGGNVTAGSFSQSGGASLTGTGALSVTGNFSQSGGSVTMGSIAINQTSGNLVTGNLSAPAITLVANAGAISQSGALVAGALATSSSTGTNLDFASNQIGTLAATNTGAGPIVLVNNTPLTLATVTNAGGDIDVTNTGAITTTGPLVASSGNVTLIANSPLTVGAGGITAGGDIVLHATNLTSPGNLTLNGNLMAGNTVRLTADNDMVQNFAVVGTNGVTAQAGGSFTFGPLATTNAPPIVYTAGGVPVTPPPTVLASSLQAPGDILVTFLDLLQKAIDGPVGEVLETNPDGSKKKKSDDEGVVAEGELCR